ncbi:CitMHS family transporter [Sporolituus thermophilus]|uniref:Citrate-Mg2+:H+ or citrate-Ca2+:H+ symporter, CitMHS family n=1 Tax=Sporolituus thermophilus DSM 23256 TaxID=1123285 RepID=A0A1G7KHB9_9FIRM|nr:CitMHS family transporter [Sporolituus thermophilus]SDF36633.1 citrate-Mg2+:H+ or citrate-Ca2+:H+ symporter, CitMHS family [Sporolituus thermophilus DSM 23256]
MSTLAIMGFLMVIVFMYLIMSKRLSAMTALMLVPVAFAIALGFGPKIGSMALDGIKKVAPTAIMICFAILYFGVMIDAGLFDPLINRILKAVKGDPLKVIVGTALLAGIVSLDGDGSTTYMITVSSMYAVHRRLGIHPLILPAMAIMQNGVMNILPWGGPTGRVMSALNLDASQVFVPLIPGMIAGTLWVLFVAYRLGLKERARLGIIKLDHAVASEMAATASVDADADNLKRPKLFWVNLAMTAALMTALVMEMLPLNVLFMLGTSLALIINYPKLSDQQERIKTHAANALPVITMIFAAGIFMGIMSGTKMVDAMAKSLVSVIPPSMGPHLALITAFASLPFTFFLTNDAFYFGIVPILVKTAASYGISPAEIARASLIGQGTHLLSPLVASTYLLVGMSGVDFGEFQKFTLLWSIGTSIVMLIVALLLGVIPF